MQNKENPGFEVIFHDDLSKTKITQEDKDLMIAVIASLRNTPVPKPDTITWSYGH